eukprot:755170_1
MDYYYYSMKQILLTQISNLIDKQNKESNWNPNDDLKHLCHALEQVKSYDHNTHFTSMIKQFECELTADEHDTLQCLTHNDDDAPSDAPPWIFYKGFKEWYNTIYIQRNGSLSNTMRSGTYFTGAPSEELQHQLYTLSSTNDDQHVHHIWQTLLGINLLKQFESQQITTKHIMGKKALIDITKCIHFERTRDQVIQASIMRLSIVQNNIFKAHIQADVIHIIDTDIFKTAAFILWSPQLAATIIQICIIKNNNITLSQHTQEAQHKEETTVDVQAITDIPTTALSDDKRTESTAINSNVPSDTDLIQSPPDTDDESSSSFHTEEMSTTSGSQHSHPDMEQGARNSVNMYDDENKATHEDTTDSLHVEQELKPIQATAGPVLHLHRYYSNAANEEERWHILNQQLTQSWSHQVASTMKSFCEDADNAYTFEDVLEDILDTSEGVENSIIMSHLQQTLQWDEQKTTDFYKALKRMLINARNSMPQDSIRKDMNSLTRRGSRKKASMQILPFTGIDPAPIDSPSISLLSLSSSPNPSKETVQLPQPQTDDIFHTEKGMKNESEAKCLTVVLEECRVFKRVMRVMEFYARWVLIHQTSNAMEIEEGDEEVVHQISIYTFLCNLNNYSYTQLWNDSFHIRQSHVPCGDTTWNRRIGEKVCIAAECVILSRYHRCRDNEIRLEMYHAKKGEEIITQQLCDVIHCMLFHPIEVDRSAMDENDDDDDDEEDTQIIHNSLHIVDSALYHELRGDRMKHHKFLTAIKGDDSVDKKCDKITDISYTKQRSNKAYTRLPGLEDDDADEWEKFMQIQTLTDLDECSAYDDFHDELLNNRLCNISQEQWNDTMRRAELFCNTWKGKQMKSRTNGSRIPLEYVVALMIWSNFDRLRYVFGQHCGDIKNTFQFSRWCFYLRAAIQCYGHNMEEGEAYYVCVSRPLMLDKLWLQFTHPTSLTRSYCITQIYSNNPYHCDGVIFVLNHNLNRCGRPNTYMNCSWLSDYGYEESEHLVLGACVRMEIKSLCLCNDHYEYYTPYIFTLNWWDTITNITSYMNFDHKLGEDKEKILLQMLMNYESQTNTNMMPYIQSLFNHLCTRRTLSINLTLLHDLLLSPRVEQRFIDAKDGHVDFWRLMSLFPHATKLSISLNKGLSLDSFICDKFLKAIHRANHKYSQFNLNIVIITSDQQNKNLKQQLKHLLKLFQTHSWMLLFTKAGNKVKFQKNTSFQKN